MKDWCLIQVSQYDYERYLTTLFMPQNMRPPLWALYAFNLEIAKTREVVSQATLGLIRLQWWRDAITKLYEGHIDAHEVLTALAKYKDIWTKDDFIALIDAREGDFNGETFETEQNFLKHGTSLFKPLFQMALKVEGVQEKELENIAYGYGVCRALRAYHEKPDMDVKKIISEIDLPKKAQSKTGNLYRKLTKLHIKQLTANGDLNKIDPMLPFKLWLTR